MPQFWTPEPAAGKSPSVQRDADALQRAIGWCIAQALPYSGFVLTLPEHGDAILAFLGADGQPCGVPERSIDPNGVAVLRLLQLTLHEALVVCMVVR
jgi:hypothetical protein